MVVQNIEGAGDVPTDWLIYWCESCRLKQRQWIVDGRRRCVQCGALVITIYELRDIEDILNDKPMRSAIKKPKRIRNAEGKLVDPPLQIDERKEQ